MAWVTDAQVKELRRQLLRGSSLQRAVSFRQACMNRSG
jgi:hypothetical protein